MIAVGGGAGALINLQTVTVATNSTQGITSINGGASVQISNVSVWDNGGIGLNAASSGAIVSFKNNSVQGNAGGDGAPTSSPGQI